MTGAFVLLSYCKQSDMRLRSKTCMHNTIAKVTSKAFFTKISIQFRFQRKALFDITLSDKLEIINLFRLKLHLLILYIVI